MLAVLGGAPPSPQAQAGLFHWQACRVRLGAGRRPTDHPRKISLSQAPQRERRVRPRDFQFPRDPLLDSSNRPHRNVDRFQREGSGTGLQAVVSWEWDGGFPATDLQSTNPLPNEGV